MTTASDLDFSFIDLFAGIGGIRLGFEEVGGECVMTSEVDKFARQTYRAYFGSEEEHLFNEDITTLPPDEVPDHDVLLGGFPCQSFSLAGVSKKNSLGREHGFEDPTTGTLFFDIKEILLEKQPSAFLLENVKNLRSHDGGQTWEVIAAALDAAGYAFTDKIIDAADILPQHRERIFIVGFHRETFDLGDERFDWTPFWSGVERELDERRERERKRHGVSRDEKWPRVGAVLEPHDEVPDKYTLTENLWEYLQDYKEKHRARGNGFGYGMVTGNEDYTRTISARYYKDGSEVLVEQPDRPRPRRLTPRECARLQGYPEDFEAMFDREHEQPVSDTQAYKQFGNSVCVPVIEAIAEVQVQYLSDPERLRSLPESNDPYQPEFDIVPSEEDVLMGTN